MVCVLFTGNAAQLPNPTATSLFVVMLQFAFQFEGLEFSKLGLFFLFEL